MEKMLFWKIIFLEKFFFLEIFFLETYFLRKKLQHVQNCAARLVMKKRIPVGGMERALVNLHWLKVIFRYIFKLLVIVHNCLHDTAPVEIMSLLQYGDSNRTKNLRETKCCNKFGVKGILACGS